MDVELPIQRSPAYNICSTLATEKQRHMSSKEHMTTLRSTAGDDPDVIFSELCEFKVEGCRRCGVEPSALPHLPLDACRLDISLSDHRGWRPTGDDEGRGRTWINFGRPRLNGTVGVAKDLLGDEGKKKKSKSVGILGRPLGLWLGWLRWDEAGTLGRCDDSCISAVAPGKGDRCGLASARRMLSPWGILHPARGGEKGLGPPWP